MNPAIVRLDSRDPIRQGFRNVPASTLSAIFEEKLLTVAVLNKPPCDHWPDSPVMTAAEEHDYEERRWGLYQSGWLQL